MTEPADPDLLAPHGDPIDASLSAEPTEPSATVDPVDRFDPSPVDPVDAGDGRRHAARIALAAVLLAPFVVLGGYAVLVDRADDASVAAASGSGPGAGGAAPSTTAVGTGVTNMTPLVPWQTQFLACVRQTESGDDYTAVNPSGAGGAYQIMPTTWNNTAQHIGRTDLVGIAPQYATPSDQDLVAAGLLEWQGPGEWQDGCG